MVGVNNRDKQQSKNQGLLSALVPWALFAAAVTSCRRRILQGSTEGHRLCLQPGRYAVGSRHVIFVFIAFSSSLLKTAACSQPGRYAVGCRHLETRVHESLPLWSVDSVASLVHILWQLRVSFL